MTISQFAEYFSVDIREVDYWTRIGLIHPEVHENGYRDYGSLADKEIRVILVALMLDYPGSLKSKYDMLMSMDDDKWHKILEQIKKRNETFNSQYNIAIDTVVRKMNGE